MAGRLPPDLPRRARLRLQVEHGLDARHARVRLEGARAPPLPSPRADVLDGLCVERELRPAALPRRGRPRQGLADAARCPATAGSASRTCARSTATCGRIPASSSSSWACEFGQEKEWSEPAGSLDWHLLEQADHAGMLALMRDLNAVYAEEPALWELDHTHEGFLWLEPNAANENVLAYARRSENGKRWVVVACNFAPVVREGWRIGLPKAGKWREALNTDSRFYGGSDVGNGLGIESEKTPLERAAAVGRDHAAAARRRLAGAGSGIDRPGAAALDPEQGSVQRHADDPAAPVECEAVAPRCVRSRDASATRRGPRRSGTVRSKNRVPPRSACSSSRGRRRARSRGRSGCRRRRSGRLFRRPRSHRRRRPGRARDPGCRRLRARTASCAPCGRRA